MRLPSLTLTLAALLGPPSLPTAEPLNVVATLPDFGSIASSVGGDHVEVTSLAKGTEDAHFVDPRPSFIRVLNRADLLLYGGLDLEIGWLPPLVDNARNKRILPGQPGLIDMSEGIPLLEVPTQAVDRSMGDVHPRGNPHFWLDPLNGKIMAHHIAQALGKADPEHRADFERNARAFSDEIDRRLAAWTATMATLKGVRLVTYHKSYEYFAARFGLEIVGHLEPLPGIEPSPAHITRLIPEARSQGVRLVIVEPFRPLRTPEKVADSIGARLVVVPDKTGGHPKVKDYLGVFDYAVEQLATAKTE